MSTDELDNSILSESGSIIIESTLPPTTSHDLLEEEGATVLVYSHDAGLARVIRNVAADRYPIRIIDEWSDLLSLVGSGSGRIVLLDVDALSVDVERALADINRCTDWLVMVIAAKQHQAHDFMRFWSERRIHRLLIKPAAVGITRLLLESAFARFIELRELHENTDSMEIPHELVAEEDKKQRRRWFWPAFAAGVVAVAGVGAIVVNLFSSPVPDAPVTQLAAIERSAVEETDVPAEPVPQRTALPLNESLPGDEPAVSDVSDTLSSDPFEAELVMAVEAELRGDFVDPPEANALDIYMSIISTAPDHAVAQERLASLLEAQFAIAQEQILERDYGDAELTLEHIARGNPSGSRLQFLQDQVRQLSATATVASSAALAPVEELAPTIEEPVLSEPTELQSMLILARLRLDEGLLVEPAGDSARDYLRRAIDLGAGDADIAPHVEQFATQAAGAIPAALAAGNPIAANAMLSTATELGSDNPELTALDGEVAAAMAQIAREENLSLHAQALRRIDDGILIGREDSASALLDQLRDRAADPSLIDDLESRLSDSLSTAARDAIAGGRWNEADALLAAFSDSAIELPDIRTLELDLAAARRQASYLAETIPVGEMTLLEAAPANYPRAAQTNEVTGWVDLHFTVNAEGATSDIDVVAAEPEGQFEDAAITALSGYVFEPWQFEERVYQRRVRLRMRFELD